MSDEPEETAARMRMQIVLRSGASIEVDVKEFTTGRTPITGTLAELTWTTVQGWTDKLHFINLAEVVAIVVHDRSDRG